MLLLFCLRVLTEFSIVKMLISFVFYMLMKPLWILSPAAEVYLVTIGFRARLPIFKCMSWADLAVQSARVIC